MSPAAIFSAAAATRTHNGGDETERLSEKYPDRLRAPGPASARGPARRCARRKAMCPPRVCPIRQRVPTPRFSMKATMSTTYWAIVKPWPMPSQGSGKKCRRLTATTPTPATTPDHSDESELVIARDPRPSNVWTDVALGERLCLHVYVLSEMGGESAKEMQKTAGAPTGDRHFHRAESPCVLGAGRFLLEQLGSFG